jgi:hypothetical protein
MTVYVGFDVVWQSPACKTHLTPGELEARQEVEDRIGRVQASIEPACWSWTPPPTSEEDLLGLLDDQGPDELDRRYLAIDLLAFKVFHDGRCAICGCTPAPVQDHDHSTGMVRGNLCRGCNVAEGASAHPVFVKYRARNPASILRVRLPYSGYGWVDGVPVGGWAPPKNGNAATALDLRPPTTCRSTMTDESPMCPGVGQPVARDRGAFGGVCSLCGEAVHTYTDDPHDKHEPVRAADHPPTTPEGAD